MPFFVLQAGALLTSSPAFRRYNSTSSDGLYSGLVDGGHVGYTFLFHIPCHGRYTFDRSSVDRVLDQATDHREVLGRCSGGPMGWLHVPP